MNNLRVQSNFESTYKALPLQPAAFPTTPKYIHLTGHGVLGDTAKNCSSCPLHLEAPSILFAFSSPFFPRNRLWERESHKGRVLVTGLRNTTSAGGRKAGLAGGKLNYDANGTGLSWSHRKLCLWDGFQNCPKLRQVHGLLFLHQLVCLREGDNLVWSSSLWPGEGLGRDSAEGHQQTASRAAGKWMPHS